MKTWEKCLEEAYLNLEINHIGNQIMGLNLAKMPATIYSFFIGRIRHSQINIFVPNVQCSFNIFYVVGPIFKSFTPEFGLQNVLHNFGWAIASHIWSKLNQTMLVQLLHVTQKLNGNLRKKAK